MCSALEHSLRADVCHRQGLDRHRSEMESWWCVNVVINPITSVTPDWPFGEDHSFNLLSICISLSLRLSTPFLTLARLLVPVLFLPFCPCPFYLSHILSLLPSPVYLSVSNTFPVLCLSLFTLLYQSDSHFVIYVPLICLSQNLHLSSVFFICGHIKVHYIFISVLPCAL